MSSQTTLQDKKQPTKKEKPERKQWVVIYAELPDGVIAWLSRKFQAQEIPELEKIAKEMMMLKKRLEEIEAEKEAQEYMNMLKG